MLNSLKFLLTHFSSTGFEWDLLPTILTLFDFFLLIEILFASLSVFNFFLVNILYDPKFLIE